MTNGLTTQLVTATATTTLGQLSLSADGSKLVYVQTTQQGDGTSAQLRRLERGADTPFKGIAATTRLVLLPNGAGVISTTQGGFEVLDLSNLIAVTGTSLITTAVAGAAITQVFTVTHVGALQTGELAYSVSSSASDNPPCSASSLNGLPDSVDSSVVTRTITCTITPNQDTPTGNLTTTLRVIPTYTDNTPADNTVTVTVPLIRQATLTATLSADSITATAGGDVTYHLRVTNQGPSSAKNVKATVWLSDSAKGLTLTANLNECSLIYETPNLLITCEESNLRTGDNASHEFNIVVKVSATFAGVITATAEVTAPESSQVITPTPAIINTTVIKEVNLVVGLASQGTAVAGKAIRLKGSVTNSGRSSATNLRLKAYSNFGLIFGDCSKMDEVQEAAR
ncbi:MAG: hypothetical protein HC853_01385 [Anaerolineae bacterium]|nr:hypothetical protein [Anaerolineae bacterium]